MSPDAGACWMTVTFASASCSKVTSEIMARVRSGSWTDPYTEENFTSDYENVQKGVQGADWVTDLAWREALEFEDFVDEMRLSFYQQRSPGANCIMFGCAMSNNTIAGASANYCNLHDLYCGEADGCAPLHHDFSGGYTEEGSTLCMPTPSACVTTTSTTAATTTATAMVAAWMADAAE